MVFDVGCSDYAHVFGVEVGEEGGAFLGAEVEWDVDLPIRKALGGGCRSDASHFPLFACHKPVRGADVCSLTVLNLRAIEVHEKFAER